MGGNEKCGQRRFAFNETETAHPSDARARTVAVGRSLLTQLRRSPAKRKEACFLLTFVRKVERATSAVVSRHSRRSLNFESGENFVVGFTNFYQNGILITLYVGMHQCMSD